MKGNAPIPTPPSGTNSPKPLEPSHALKRGLSSVMSTTARLGISTLSDFSLARSGAYSVSRNETMPSKAVRSTSPNSANDAWNRVVHLTATLGSDELRASAPEQLLYRLYHEESVRLFEPRPLAFGCSCSRERVVGMLRSLGRDEVEAALAARGDEIEVVCEFCAQRYHFDRIDAELLLGESVTPAVPDTTQ